MSEFNGGTVEKAGLSELDAVNELIGLGIRIAQRFRLPPVLELESPCSLPAASVLRRLAIGAYSYLGQHCELRSTSTAGSSATPPWSPSD